MCLQILWCHACDRFWYVHSFKRGAVSRCQCSDAGDRSGHPDTLKIIAGVEGSVSYTFQRIRKPDCFQGLQAEKTVSHSCDALGNDDVLYYSVICVSIPNVWIVSERRHVIYESISIKKIIIRHIAFARESESSLAVESLFDVLAHSTFLDDRCRVWNYCGVSFKRESCISSAESLCSDCQLCETEKRCISLYTRVELEICGVPELTLCIYTFLSKSTIFH